MIRLTYLVSFCIIILTACNDDFNLEGDYVDVPTAYAYLNADDDRHFVRVQKAFLQAGGNALEQAAAPDSIYYGPGEATVRLTNLSRQTSAVLDRVDGREFGLERSDGIFATAPNTLYTVEDADVDFRAGDEVRLDVERPGATVATAETQLLDDVVVVAPRSMIRLEPYGDNQTSTITFTQPEGAEVFAITLLIRLRAAGDDLQLVWPIATDFVPTGRDQNGNNVRIALDNESFYRFLADNLEPRDVGFYTLRDISVRITAAGNAVLDRRLLFGANNGITSSQARPRFSNLEGGIGLVTGVSESTQEGITLSNASMDSLANGIYTGELFN